MIEMKKEESSQVKRNRRFGATSERKLNQTLSKSRTNENAKESNAATKRNTVKSNKTDKTETDKRKLYNKNKELAKDEKKQPQISNTVKRKRTNNRRQAVKPSMKVAFLGGLNEIGKNVTVFECQNDMFILDCGMAFPDAEMPGVDLVITDFSYI